MRGMCTEKNGALYQLGAKKITFPPKRVDRWTDICIYRVTTLLIRKQKLQNVSPEKITKKTRFQENPRNCYLNQKSFILRYNFTHLELMEISLSLVLNLFP